MLLSNQPTKVQVPFANSGTKNTIPVASQIGITAGAASFTDGFPPLTFTPIASGGVPPAGADFNGILNATTSILRWQCGGGHFTYDSSWSTANGGYAKGAMLLKADGSGFWFNTTDSNTVNPDTVGTGWSDFATVFGVSIETTASDSTYASVSATHVASPQWVKGATLGSATQSWQVVTGSRAAGTTYYNTTNKPIQVFVESSAGTTGVITVGSTSMEFVQGASSPRASISVIVPPGIGYSSTNAFNAWFELR